MSSTSNRRRVSVPVSGTALLLILIDVINDMAFEGFEALVSQALEAVEAIEASDDAG